MIGYKLMLNCKEELFIIKKEKEFANM